MLSVWVSLFIEWSKWLKEKTPAHETTAFVHLRMVGNVFIHQG